MHLARDNNQPGFLRLKKIRQHPEREMRRAEVIGSDDLFPAVRSAFEGEPGHARILDENVKLSASFSLKPLSERLDAVGIGDVEWPAYDGRAAGCSGDVCGSPVAFPCVATRDDPTRSSAT